MKQFFLAGICLLLLTNAIAQPITPLSFPQNLIGHWTGELEWSPVGKPVQKVHMELHILPSKDSAGQYTWNLIYGTAGADNRPYVLKAVDSSKGHWVIDERNGIVLDQFWIGNRLIGSFSVGEVTIVNSYWLKNQELELEFISYDRKPLLTTGHGTEDSPKVDSYSIRSYQKATLKRK